MNYCLRHQCKNGYAVADVFKFRYDNFGSYRYWNIHIEFRLAQDEDTAIAVNFIRNLQQNIYSFWRVANTCKKHYSKI